MSNPLVEKIARIICEMADVVETKPGEPFENAFACETPINFATCMAKASAIIELFRERIDHLHDRFGLIASKNDLSDVASDSLEAQASAAFAALYECELIARNAIDEDGQVIG